eukprot:TRINITY_DN5026_c1_g1_i1.p1 TRINITY_DN5026_c1_g1~~TRINITY_DN5026_c1_g1_i1.p1  ORF type:complete len:1576 (+),score=83.95 TRINITY_DN5026_c1_g1_i1:679-4728(+)
MGTMLLECIALDLLYLLLYQDNNLTIYCFDNWKVKGLDLLAKLTIISGFILDPIDSYWLLFSISVLSLLGAKILLQFYLPLPYYCFGNMSELFIDFTLFLIQAFIFICNFYLDSYYHYTLFIPVYSYLLCVIRVNIKSILVEPCIKTEEGMLDYLRDLLRLFYHKNLPNSANFWGLLSFHKNACAVFSCACKTIFAGKVNDDYSLCLNKTTYEDRRDIPENRRHSWRLKALRVLINDIDRHLTKFSTMFLALAEISYYYFANHYQALCYIGSLLESRRQSVLITQHTVNMRNVIESGMRNNKESASSLLRSLEYQNMYSKFLSCIEDSTELTVKFWSTLITDSPDCEALMRYGKELHEKRYEFFQLARDLIKQNPNHLEFLIKLGLYTKLILHDKFSTSHTFQQIQWSAQNQTLMGSKLWHFREGDNGIFMVISLEQNSLFTVLQVNEEVEYGLGYKAEELIRLSAYKLMPEMVARKHPQFVEKFFKTMHCRSINRKRVAFLKHKQGYLVSFRMHKRIVPSVLNGLQIAVLLYKDCLLPDYTGCKIDKTEQEVGVVLCDSNQRVLDATKKGYEYLGIDSGSFQSIINSGMTMDELFPELHNKVLAELASTSRGMVIRYNTENAKVFNGDQSAGSEENETSILMWIRVTSEKYGDSTLNLLLLSPILEEYVDNYYSLAEYDHTVYKRRTDVIRLRPLQEPRDNTLSRESSPNNAPSQFDCFSQELQTTASSREPPALVKRLTFVSVTFLFVVLVLLGVETAELYKETVELKERFKMIEYFQIRYEILIYLALSPKTYNTYRKGPVPATFIGFCKRTRIRAERGVQYALKVRKYFEKFKLDYDYRNLVVSYSGDKYFTSFYYAFTKYINEVMTFTKLNDYDLARYCMGNYEDSVCVENNLSLDYCAENGVYSLRIQQDKLSEELMKDLFSFGDTGKKKLYIITSICISIVVLSSTSVIVLLILVVKDKSSVMAIFADILREEIEQVIHMATCIAISETRFDVQDVRNANGNEEKYWQAATKYRDIKKPEDTQVLPENENTRKVLLGKIDKALLKSSICRLGIFLLSFLAYGIFSLYINYYIHSMNATIADFFYQLSKRNSYGVALTGIMKEAVQSKRKFLLLNNPDPSSGMYAQDYLDEMRRVEERINEYTRTTGHSIFGNYFDLMEKLNSPQLCDYIDGYQIGQTSTCRKAYGGPKDQGLAAGMSFYLSYHQMYITKILSVDFNNQTAFEKLATDAGLTFPGSALITYLQPALELSLIEYRKDAVNFYEKVQILVIAKAGFFTALFLGLYVFVLLHLLERLKEEIWVTQGILSMVPTFILEGNLKVREQIWKRRRTGQSYCINQQQFKGI